MNKYPLTMGVISGWFSQAGGGSQRYQSMGSGAAVFWGLSVFLSETQNQIDNATVQDIATFAPPFGIILDGFARQIQIWNTCALTFC